MKIEATKDGNGNIIITEDSFEMILACLDNQKFVGEPPQNGDSISVGKEKYDEVQKNIQDAIDSYNKQCRKILHQKYVVTTHREGYFLVKRYEYQDDVTPWSGKDIELVDTLFKGTIRKKCVPEDLLPMDGSEDIKKGTNPIGKTQDGWMSCSPVPRPWMIEAALWYDGDYLTLSEDGKNNRPWKQEEIESIQKLLNNQN